MGTGLFPFCGPFLFRLFSNAFLTPSAIDAPGQLFRHGLLPLSLQVAVDIGRRPDIGVSHPLLDFFQAASVVDEEACAAMAKLVEADMRQAVFLEQLPKTVADVIGSNRPSVRPAENIFRFHVGFPKKPRVFSLFRLLFLEQCPHFRQQGKTPVAAFGFRLVFLYGRIHLYDRVLDGQDLVFKVDAVPFEAQYLAPA